MGSTYTKLVKDDYKFLEMFLDTTKANLFFAKGVILVEGWAEEILIPCIAKAIGINLTEKGVSIVNIGHTGFDHYSKIYLRQAEPNMGIPVAIVTDSDIREYEISGDDITKRETSTIQQETATKLAAINGKSESNVQYFPASSWTLEYSLFKSACLSTVFKNVVKRIHSGTDWNTDFEKELAKKLINKGLNKTEIAYQIANAINEDLEKFEKKEISVKTITISEDESDSINYLIKAIKYASCN
jgi:putative ATP-dependent endonuclease of OLD family